MNRITSICNSQNIFVDIQKAISEVVVDYFQKLFTTEQDHVNLETIFKGGCITYIRGG